MDRYTPYAPKKKKYIYHYVVLDTQEREFSIM